MAADDNGVSPDENMKSALNCDMWAEVDFGRGPVLVRCTGKGLHIDHLCVVVMEQG